MRFWYIKFDLLFTQNIVSLLLIVIFENQLTTMADTKSNANPNMQSILRSAGLTIMIYLAINLIAFGWVLIFHDFSGDFSIELKYLAISIDGDLKGISWQNTTTKILLILIFIAFIADDFRRGRAQLQSPVSGEKE